MSSFRYSYDYVTYFATNGLKINQLNTEVVTITAKPYSHSYLRDDVVKIKFFEELTIEEQTSLDNIVANHVPLIIEQRDTISFALTPFHSHSEDYRPALGFIFPGKIKKGHIKEICIASYMDSGANSYSVRLFDLSSHKTLIEKTGLNNTNPTIILLGGHDDLNFSPDEVCILELQIKRLGGDCTKQVHISALQIDF